MSEIKVNSIKGVGASTAAITVYNSDGTCTANITNRSNRNLIINGNAKVAQRSTSAVASAGYHSVDRYQLDFGGGTDENPSQEQGTVAAGTTPYTEGFRKTVKITNGNQTTSPASNPDLYFQILYKLEGQDIANSGWNYLSTSSNITLSFWVKSSVAQEFYFRLQTSDGTSYNYPMSTGSLSANTWTKVTKTIPGNSNLQFDDDNGQSLTIEWVIYRGTNKTGSDATLDTWKVYDGSQRVPDVTTSFYTTNDATFEITGVQLEVGSVATDFEHRLYAQELALCQRYFYKTYRQGIAPGTDDVTDIISKRNEMASSRTDHVFNVAYSVPMRATPTITAYSKAGNSNKFLITGQDYSGGSEGTFAGTVYRGRKYLNQVSAGTTIPSGSYAHFHFTADAEL